MARTGGNFAIEVAELRARLQNCSALPDEHIVLFAERAIAASPGDTGLVGSRTVVVIVPMGPSRLGGP